MNDADDIDMPADIDVRRLRAAGQPTFQPPMLATLVDAPFYGDAWVVERKLDGVRCIVVKDGDAVHLYSRNGNDMDASFPEIATAIGLQPVKSFVVDGEIVTFDGATTSFSKLQRRLHVERPSDALQREVPVMLYLFDLLQIGGVDVRRSPLRERKALLLRSMHWDDPIRFSQHRNGHVRSAFDKACNRGWEGLIAKRASSSYVSRRSRDWLKLKCVNEQEFIVAGFTDPAGSRSGFGSLILAYHDKSGSLRLAGRVGTGFGDDFLTRFADVLHDEEVDEPIAGLDVGDEDRDGSVHWVRPCYVAQVGFSEWTPQDRLRHPRFLGLRTDKDARDVVRERPRAAEV